MFYFAFVIWLMRKTYHALLRFDPFYSSGAGKYNRLDESFGHNAPLGILGITIVGLIFLGTPMAGYVCLVAMLPLSPIQQWWVLVVSAVLVFAVVARYLLKHATKQR